MSRHSHVHTLLSLTLFLLFVIGSFFVVTYEIRGYQRMNDQCYLEDQLNIPLAYLNTKMKAGDEKDSIDIVSFQGQQCLRMMTSQTVTYIYYQNGYMKELYASVDYQPSLDEGRDLFALDNFQIKKQDSLYTFIVQKDQNEKSLSIYLHT